MKKVFDPKSKEIVIIDETKHADRQSKFYHWTGVPFVWQEVIQEPKEIQQPVQVEYTLEDIQSQYEAKFGKLPPRYKNDIERLSKKLYS